MDELRENVSRIDELMTQIEQAERDLKDLKAQLDQEIEQYCWTPEEVGFMDIISIRADKDLANTIAMHLDVMQQDHEAEMNGYCWEDLYPLTTLYIKIDRIDTDIAYEHRMLDLDIGSEEHIESRLAELSAIRVELIQEIEQLNQKG